MFIATEGNIDFNQRNCVYELIRIFVKRSVKLTDMATTNVKLLDIPLYFSLNFWPKHLSLRQKQRAKYIVY